MFEYAARNAEGCSMLRKLNCLSKLGLVNILGK